MPATFARRSLRPLLIVLLLGGALVTTSLFGVDRWMQRGQRPWPLPAFTGVTQDGRPIDVGALRGRVWIADFIYTSCTTACPILTSRMVLLARGLSPAIGFLSFSVDPVRDSPAVLAAYARRWNPGGRLWTLIAMPPTAVDAMAAGMQVTVDRDGDDGAIVHTNQFFLIDRDGRVRGAYDSLDDRDMAALARDAAALEGSTSSPGSGAVTDGARLFAELGCAGCHHDARIAPPLGGLRGRHVALEGGGEVEATDAYLRESVLSPGTRIVKGYAATMPSYASVLSDAQVGALLTYLSSVPAGGESTAVTTAIDPVCGMRVVVTSDTPRVVRDGGVDWFCSEACRDRFLAHPERPRRVTQR